MRVVLIGKKHIIKNTLNINNIEDFWLVDNTQESNNKLVKMNMTKGNFKIISSEYSKVLDKQYLRIISNKLTISQPLEYVVNETVLEENHMYPILMNDTNEVRILYCMPDYEDYFIHLDIINTKEITIGRGNNNSIVYKSPLIEKLHARLYKNGDKWTLENYDSKYGIFVNHYPVYNNLKNIFNGDIIFIMGLEIIIIKDTIYVNNPDNRVSLNRYCFKSSKIEEELMNKKYGYKKKHIDKDKQRKINYFSRAPRMIPPIEKEELSIDEPPGQVSDQKMPRLLMMGSTIIMGIFMLTSLSSTVEEIASGKASTSEIIIGLISTIAMILAMFLLPIIEERWEKNNNIKYETERQNKYKDYLKQKREIINDIKRKQKNILFQTYLSVNECVEVIKNEEPRLWERKNSDEDFLAVRIGLGQVPLEIEIPNPKEGFSMEEDKLMTELKNVINYAETIDNCPVIMSFKDNNNCSLVSTDDEFTRKYLKNIILQLITFHSYEDLKLVFLVDKKNSKDWEYVKMLPHNWDDSKQFRFYADNYDDMNEISKYLTEELSNRTEDNQIFNGETIFTPHYLVITDNYKLIENLSFVSEFIKKSGSDIGFSLFCISKDVYSLPSECTTFIDIRNDIRGFLYEKNTNQIKRTEIKLEQLVTVFYEEIAQKLSNIPIREKRAELSLPKSYSFLEMYEVGNIEQLNILERWKKNDSTLSLKAPIGIDSSGMIISLDAHEKFHGPHGLIAGSTGSGKSEFIITYILSLAINYHPDDVNFLLIDYKGGGLAGAFQKQNIKLPHLVGTITNIDKNGLERSLTSIQSELRKREIMFNEARNITNEGTIDIYKYQKLYHDGVVDKPISHLFIICDEFAELKQQQPDFMDELVSVSRIGRSLGVHLILATQKPSGIVDDQIRSNSKFAVCLKVQDTSDSQDVILRPDAAFLKNPGQFYLKVGHNEFFTLGQSGWAGALYIASNAPIKKLDTTVEFVSNIGFPIKKIDEDSKKDRYESRGEQLTNILYYICDIAKQKGITTNNLWLESIPQDIYIDELRKKYHSEETKDIEVVVGEFDDPYNQRQGLVKLDFSNRDNVIIYGNTESGKETMLSTIIYDTITSYTSEQVNIYILDFGTEALKIFKNTPHVGDTVFMGEDEKIVTFFDMIQKIILERKQILSDYNGDYNLYIKKGNIMPIITVILNNYEVFSENYEDKFDDLFLTLTRDGAKCGVLFIVTVSTANAMRYRLTANFSKKIALMLNDEDDYYSIFDRVGTKRPARMFGRGLVSIQNGIYEFQTAKICEHANYNEHIEEIINSLNNKKMPKANPIPTLPNKIEIKDVKKYLTDLSKVPIGLIKTNLEVYLYDFINNFMTLIVAKNMSNAVELTKYIIQEAENIENVKVTILDAEEAKSQKKKAYKEFIKSIKNDMKSNDDVITFCVIIGIDKFTSEDIIDEYEFSELLSNAKENGKHCFIMIENPERLEEHTYDDWYTNFISQDNGIWVGNGIDNQTLLNINFSMTGLENNCGNSFGYVIKEGEPTLVKFIGIEEENEDE